MSLHRHYPPDLYRGTTGEVSAWLPPSDRLPDTVAAAGVTCGFLATGDRTAGRSGLHRWTFGREAGGPCPHVHRPVSEQFGSAATTPRCCRCPPRAVPARRTSRRRPEAVT